jgi:hypothetical protein
MSFRSFARVLVPLAVAFPFAAHADKTDKPAGKPAASASASASASNGATGKLSRAEFEDALKPHLGEMFQCYDKALKKDALAEGTVILVIETQNGKVTKGDTDREVSTMKLEEAHKCIVGLLKKMKMPIAHNAEGKPDPKAKAVVRYPVEFSLGIEVGAGPSKETGAKLDHDKVKNVFFVNKLEFGRCQLDAKKAHGGVSPVGKLVLKVSVTGGAVTAVEAVKPDTTVEDKDMLQCSLDAVKKFKFPKAKDSKGNDDDKASSVIVYPMDFTSH